MCQNVLCSANDATDIETAAVKRLSIMLSALNLGAVQIENCTRKPCVVLQLCVAHCLSDFSTPCRNVEKSLRTTNERTFSAPMMLWHFSFHHNALYSTDNAKKAVTAAMRILNRYTYLILIPQFCLYACMKVHTGVWAL